MGGDYGGMRGMHPPPKILLGGMQTQATPQQLLLLVKKLDFFYFNYYVRLSVYCIFPYSYWSSL